MIYTLSIHSYSVMFYSYPLCIKQALTIMKHTTVEHPKKPL